MAFNEGFAFLQRFIVHLPNLGFIFLVLGFELGGLFIVKTVFVDVGFVLFILFDPFPDGLVSFFKAISFGFLISDLPFHTFYFFDVVAVG
jgi:hypothetical protein